MRVDASARKFDTGADALEHAAQQAAALPNGGELRADALAALATVLRTAGQKERVPAVLTAAEYPYEGSSGINKVVLKRVGAREIEETDKRDGRVEGTARMTVAPDGQTMTMVFRDRQGRVSTFVWNKQ